MFVHFSFLKREHVISMNILVYIRLKPESMKKKNGLVIELCDLKLIDCET